MVPACERPVTTFWLEWDLFFATKPLTECYQIFRAEFTNIQEIKPKKKKKQLLTPRKQKTTNIILVLYTDQLGTMFHLT